MDEEPTSYPCDFIDCEEEDAKRLMVVEGQPMAVLCDEHMERIETQTKDNTHKVALDIHFHKHTIVDLVTSDFEPLEAGAEYMDGAPIQ